MQIRRIILERFRGIRRLETFPGARTVILGPNNAAKSAVLEGLDWLLHHGIGRPRPAPSEIDYFGRETEAGFVVEAVLGDLPPPFAAEVREHLEGWNDAEQIVVAETDGEGIEPIVRVRVRGTDELDIVHEFAKPESEGTRFSPRLRLQTGWVFDGRIRDPAQQLAFYQGGLLERLFAGADLQPAIAGLRAALAQGANTVNDEQAIAAVLSELAGDLRRLGLVGPEGIPQFEVGAVSRRELLQALRLTLPNIGTQIPLARQGRGAQRLVLVAVLLRLAKAAGRPPIGAFEEPEEALEPLRQTELARMLRSISDTGGQVFVVTHSPEIARTFEIDDFLLLREGTGGADARPLRRVLPPAVRQAYERWLDGAVVRGLFARVPVLVEGAGDRAVMEVFWRALETREGIRPASQLGVDLVNCEGVPNMPMLATVLDHAGKAVVAWVDQDSEKARLIIERLRREEHCSGLVLHDPTPHRQNLEQALVFGASLPALVEAMQSIAVDRGYSWEEQRADLVSRAHDVPRDLRPQMNEAESLMALMNLLEEKAARDLMANALSARGVTPFEMKGGRQARLVAEKIVERDGVPRNFGRMILELHGWIEGGCGRGFEITMSVD